MVTTTSTTETPSTTGVLSGLRVNVDGTMEDVQIPAAGNGSHVEGLNRVIGSRTFDVVGMPDGIDVFVDDEGLYTAVHNPVLSDMLSDLSGTRSLYYLHGAGVFLGSDAETGDTLTLTPTQRGSIAASWFAAAPL